MLQKVLDTKFFRTVSNIMESVTRFQPGSALVRVSSDAQVTGELVGEYFMRCDQKI